MQPVFLTRQQAAELLGVSLATVNRMLARGELPSVTIGRLRRIPVIALEEMAREAIEERVAP